MSARSNLYFRKIVLEAVEEWIGTRDDVQQGHQLGNNCSGQIVEGRSEAKKWKRGEECWETLKEVGTVRYGGQIREPDCEETGSCCDRWSSWPPKDSPKRTTVSWWIHYTLIGHLFFFFFFLMFVLSLLFLPVHLEDRETCLVFSWE